MRSHHPSPCLRWGDFTLIEWRDDVNHADAQAHKKSPHQKHGDVHRRSLDDARDDAQNRCDLYSSLAPERIAHPCHQEAADEAARCKDSIRGAGDTRAFGGVGAVKVDSEVSKERLQAKNRTDDGRVIAVG